MKNGTPYYKIYKFSQTMFNSLKRNTAKVLNNLFSYLTKVFFCKLQNVWSNFRRLKNSIFTSHLNLMFSPQHKWDNHRIDLPNLQFTISLNTILLLDLRVWVSWWCRYRLNKMKNRIITCQVKSESQKWTQQDHTETGGFASVFYDKVTIANLLSIICNKLKSIWK